MGASVEIRRRGFMVHRLGLKCRQGVMAWMVVGRVSQPLRMGMMPCGRMATRALATVTQAAHVLCKRSSSNNNSNTPNHHQHTWTHQRAAAAAAAELASIQLKDQGAVEAVSRHHTSRQEGEDSIRPLPQEQEVMVVQVKQRDTRDYQWKGQEVAGDEAGRSLSLA